MLCQWMYSEGWLTAVWKINGKFPQNFNFMAKVTSNWQRQLFVSFINSFELTELFLLTIQLFFFLFFFCHAALMRTGVRSHWSYRLLWKLKAKYCCVCFCRGSSSTLWTSAKPRACTEMACLPWWSQPVALNGKSLYHRLYSNLGASNGLTRVIVSQHKQTCFKYISSKHCNTEPAPSKHCWEM